MITELDYESVSVEDLFNDITHIDDNRLVLKTESVFKEGDKIRRVNKEEIFDLTHKDLLSELLKGEKKDIYFFQKGILKVFKKFNKKELNNYLSNLSDYNWVLMSSSVRKVLDISKSPCNLVVDNRTENKYVIVGNRNSRCVLNKETRDYYVDISDVVVLLLT